MYGRDETNMSEKPENALNVAHIHSAEKLGLAPKELTHAQCSSALMLVGKPYDATQFIVWPNGHDGVKIPAPHNAEDSKALRDTTIISGLIMSQLPADRCEISRTGLCLKRTDLALAINALAKDDTLMLTRLSELQTPLPGMSA